MHAGAGLFGTAAAPGETQTLPYSSASRSWLAIEGEGRSTIDGHTLHWQHNDVLCAPTHCAPRHTNASAQSPAFLIQVDDAPMQRRLGFHEARRTADAGDAG